MLHAKRMRFARFFGHFSCETLAFRMFFSPKLSQIVPESGLWRQKMDTYVLLCGLAGQENQKTEIRKQKRGRKFFLS
jgi:hypothetical protein